MNTQRLFDSIYSFIEKYFYFIVGVIVIALVSLTASLYAENPPKKGADSSNMLLKKYETKIIQSKAYRIDCTSGNNVNWSNVAKRYKMEVKSAKPKFT